MRAFNVESKARVFAYGEPIHMSASFPKLSKLIREELTRDPDAGDLFLFMNKRRTYVKVLFFANDGPCIFAKTLPVGRFNEVTQDKLTLGELHTLVNHVMLTGVKKQARLKIAA